MQNTPIENFLAQADFATLAAAIQNHEAFTVSNRQATMAWLKTNRNAMYYQVLGCIYDVAVYVVDGKGATASAPADEYGKFFASTLAEDFPDAPVIPLQKSMETCYLVACELLGLEKLFKAEHDADEGLGRHCHGESVSLTDILPHIMKECVELDKLDAPEMYMKLGEESGEFSKAMLIERGKLPGKKLDEPAIGEAADVIIAAVCTLAKHYPSVPPEQLSTLLSKWVNIKMAKYSAMLHQPAPTVVRQGRVGPVNKF